MSPSDRLRACVFSLTDHLWHRLEDTRAWASSSRWGPARRAPRSRSATGWVSNGCRTSAEVVVSGHPSNLEAGRLWGFICSHRQLALGPTLVSGTQAPRLMTQHHHHSGVFDGARWHLFQPEGFRVFRESCHLLWPILQGRLGILHHQSGTKGQVCSLICEQGEDVKVPMTKCVANGFMMLTLWEITVARDIPAICHEPGNLRDTHSGFLAL